MALRLMLGSVVRGLADTRGAVGLKVLGGERLARLLERAKQRSYREVPVPVAEYDGAPGRAGLK